MLGVKQREAMAAGGQVLPSRKAGAYVEFPADLISALLTAKNWQHADEGGVKADYEGQPLEDVDQQTFLTQLRAVFERFQTLLDGPRKFTEQEYETLFGRLFNDLLARNEEATTALIKSLLDVIDVPYYDGNLEKFQQRSAQDYTAPSPFRLKVKALHDKWEPEVVYQRAFRPIYEALLERRQQLYLLEKAFTTMQGPKNNSRLGYVDLYPDDGLVKTVERILVKGKTYATRFLGIDFNSSGGFDGFLTELRELNQARKDGRLEAFVDTPFASSQNKDYMLKLLSVACVKLKKNTDDFAYAQFASKNTQMMQVSALVEPLLKQLADMEEQLQLKAHEGLLFTSKIEGSLESSPVLPVDAAVVAEPVWQEVREAWKQMAESKLAYEQAKLDQALLPLIKKENAQLSRINQSCEAKLVQQARAIRRYEIVLRSVLKRCDKLEKENGELRSTIDKLCRERDKARAYSSDEMSGTDVSEEEKVKNSCRRRLDFNDTESSQEELNTTGENDSFSSDSTSPQKIAEMLDQTPALLPSSPSTSYTPRMDFSAGPVKGKSLTPERDAYGAEVSPN